MQKLYFTILLVLCGFVGKAQISGPDTVCLGAQMNFTTNYVAAKTYAWSPDSVYIQPDKISATSVLSKGSSLKSIRGMTMQYDNGTFYGFVCNNEGELVKLDFGASATLTPSVTNLGSLGGVLDDSCVGIDIARDGGNWHGFIVRNNSVIHLSFGSSLNNVPTATSTKFNFIIGYGYQITLKKFGTEWLGFVASRNNYAITRLEFGSSLANTPTATNFGSFPNLNTPVNFALYDDNGSWYMLVTNLGNDNITRYSFGANLKNNSPTATSLGNPGNMLNNPRAINIFKDENELYALVTNENSRLVKLRFDNGIDKVPSVTNLNKIGIDGKIAFTAPVWQNNILYLFGSSYSDTTIYRYNNLYTIPSGSQVYTANNTYSITATKSGAQTITLHCDQGQNAGTKSFSHSIFVVDEVRIALKQYGNQLVATGTKCDNYVWKFNNVVIPGANSDTLNGTDNGIYSVTGTIAGCTDLSTFQFFGVGVEDVNSNSALKIYPNPATGVININMEGLNSANATINCYNLLGTLVATKQVETTNNNLSATLDMSAMAKGSYYIKVQTAEGAQVSKQVVLQ